MTAPATAPMSAQGAAAVAALVQNLPALRAAVLDLLRSLDDPDVGADELAAKISHDHAIAAKTLRLANSSFFGLSRQVTAISEATAIIGMRTVRSIALGAGLVDAFESDRCPQFDLAAFWRHAIGTALCAEALAPCFDAESGIAFGFGLMHDIGRVALASALPEHYSDALRLRARDDLPLTIAEREMLGFTHADVGAALAERWQLSTSLVEAIRYHHEPPEKPGEKASLLIDITHLADNLAHALDLGAEIDDAVPPLSSLAWQRLHSVEPRLPHVLHETETRHAALCQALLKPQEG